MACHVGVRINLVQLFFNAHSQQDILLTVSLFPIFCLGVEKYPKGLSVVSLRLDYRQVVEL